MSQQAMQQALTALNDLMNLERRGRVMPIGRVWNAAYEAIATLENELALHTAGAASPAIEASDAKDAALTDERIEDMGHRYAWRYKQATADGPFYTFNAHCLRDFARAIERELKGGDSWSRVTERKPNGEPSNYERAAMSTHQPKESGNG